MMHLVYIDESGNTGANLEDKQQPVFVLAALIVPEGCWQGLENDLEASLHAALPALAEKEAVVHAGDLRAGRAAFKGIETTERYALRESWLRAAHKHQLKLIVRAIEKVRFKSWVHATFGSGVAIDPHKVAYPLVAKVIDEYLSGLAEPALGILISDERKEIVRDLEKSLKLLRSLAGPLRLSRIVEKGFFIDSSKSRILQLCDLCALSFRKAEEERLGCKFTEADREAASLIEPLIHRGNERLMDMLAWLTDQENQQNKRSGQGP